MARYNIITELASPKQPDLTMIVGNERAIMVSQLLNSSREYLYITNCRNMFERIRFELLPVSQKQLFLIDLDYSDNGGLFTNIQLNNILRKATNVLINANGDFDKPMRDKFIVYSMSNQNVNLSLLPTSYFVSKESRDILIYPNGVNNVVVSAISNEVKASASTQFTIVTSKKNAKELYLALLNMYKLNAYEIDSSLSIIDSSLTDLSTTSYSKIYIEHGIGFSKDDVEKVIDIAEMVPQLYITNHKVLYNYTSSDVLMSGVISDELLDRLQPHAKQTVPQQIDSQVAHEPVTASSSVISSNPLD